MTDVRARTSRGARNGLRYLLCGLGLVLALLSASCGNTTFTPGTAVFTITGRNSGEFTSFIVNLLEIDLTRQDGTVTALPMSVTSGQRVDLVEVSNLAEILGAPAVQVGTYVSMTLSIDYGSAQIWVKGANGHPVKVTTITDPTLSPPATAAAQTLTIQFDPNQPLVIADQKSTLVAIDIDLAAGTTINYPTPSGSPTVNVKSFVTVNATPVYNKPIRARGLLVTADTKANNIIMNTRPLHDDSNSPFGALTVLPNDQTYYNINGVAYTGAAGLAALAAVQNTYANFQIAAYGSGPGQGTPFSDLSTITPSFIATAVYAGTSLESTIQSHVIGIVDGISNNTLSVMGAEFISQYGANTVYDNIGIRFVDPLPVKIGSATVVSQDGVLPATQPTTASVSVGQLIDVSGQPTFDSSGVVPTSLDATAGPTQPGGGQIRMQSTPIWGNAVSTTPTSTCSGMTLNLLLLGNYDPAAFTFTGTEANGGGANPPTYCVNTGSIDLTSVTAASANGVQPLVRVDGFVTPFGSGPPNFDATAVTLGTQTDQQLILEWPGGTTAPFATPPQASGVVISPSDTHLSGVHVIRTGPTSQDVDVTKLATNLTIVPAAVAANTTLLLSVGNTTNQIQSSNSAQTWVTNITTALGKGFAFSKLVATGRYDSTTNTFTAYNISINE